MDGSLETPAVRGPKVQARSSGLISQAKGQSISICMFDSGGLIFYQLLILCKNAKERKEQKLC